jgi:hypothetical protein
MGRKKLYGEETTAISFKVPISKKEHFKREIRALINDHAKSKDDFKNKTITSQSDLVDSTSNGKDIQVILKTKPENEVSQPRNAKSKPKTSNKRQRKFEPKDNMIGTRVNKKLFKVLQEYARENDVNLSKLTRKALMFYNIFFIQPKKIMPMIFIQKNEYAIILEHLNEEGRKNLVDVCFNNTYQEIEKIIKEYIKDQGIDLRKTRLSPRRLMAGLKETFSSDQGQNWFKSFEYRMISKGKLMFAGLHDINKNFSLFMKDYLRKCLDRLTNYQLIDEKSVLTDNKIVLYFQSL